MSSETDLDLEEFESSLEIFSRKWQPLILYILLEDGSMSFSELKENLDGISGKVLSNNLENLVEDGYLEKKVVSESPKRVRYSASSKSSGLKPVLDDLQEWAKLNRSKEEKEVLIVDDEEKLADIYAKWLEDGFKTEVVESGEEAVEKVNQTTDVVLLDRVMPGISGEEAVEKIRETSDVPIIMVTAKDPELEMADIDVQGYLVKPVKRKEILDKVKEATKDLEDKEKRIKALKSKKEVLEEHFSSSKLEKSEEFQNLEERINRLS